MDLDKVKEEILDGEKHSYLDYRDITREHEAGVYYSEEHALQCAIEGWGDLYECHHYNFVEIRKQSLGLYLIPDKTLWFAVEGGRHPDTGLDYYKLHQLGKPILGKDCSIGFSSDIVSQNINNWITIYSTLDRIFASFELRNYSLLMEETNKIFENYTRDNRYYHNLEHIEDCLLKLSEYKLSEEEIDVLSLAIIYHDFVYELKDSENKSAKVFEDSFWFEDNRFKEVPNLIRMTKTHIASNKLEQILSDIDMSILGSSTDKYENYNEGIKKEYLSMGIPRVLFNWGRRKFNNKYSSYEYYTEEGQKLWGRNIKDNLTNDG